MKTDSTLSRFIFTSFWPLLVFLIIPFLFILNIRFHLQLPLAGNKSSVLYNNACLSVFIALRVIYYLRGLTRTIRYGADSGIPKAATETDRSVSEIKSRLTESGFQFDNAGSYAEKQDRGYLGTTLLYAGLFIVIFTGTLDNMRQFSGTFLHGVGMALDLNTNDRYRALATGPLTTEPTTLPKMKIMSHILPDATYPLGAAEVVFINPTGKEQKVILKAPDPYRAGNFDIYMARMLYEPTISVSIDGAIPVYNGRIMLKPLAAKVDDFGFYTSFVDGNLDGEVYYQPEKSRLKMVLRQGSNALMDKELIFQVERRQTMGNISFTVERMGVWSEIHVVQRRHMPVVFIGGGKPNPETVETAMVSILEK
ncbi:MAG: hypothetical protein WCL71_01390, partial [Deltaproteobacteria bacterium]